MRQISFGKLFLFVIMPILIVAASVGVAYYYYDKYHTAQVMLKDPQGASKIEAKTLVTDVSRLMELPTNEVPTLATVTDSTKLSNQDFFKRSKNGDKVLIYMQSKQAILYRPTTKKIIAVAPISITNNNQGNVAGAATGAPTIIPTRIPTRAPSAAPTFKPFPTFTPAPTTGL